MSLFRTTTPFLQNNAWQNQAVNALRYNTSQIGSVVPLIYGTVRQQINLVALGNYMGPGGGKKGKGVGPLPIGGTNTVQSGKGGGGGKGKGSKKGGGDFSVDVAFALCQGPVTFNPNNLVFANSAVEAFSATGSGAGKGSSGNQLNFYIGTDGQMPDPTFAGIGSGINYSGTCYVTGTPMDLGKSPAIPNLSFEINGIEYNTGGPNFPVDANPGNVITDFLTNPRYGANFPAAHLDNLLPGMGTSFGDYCQAAGFLISVSLDGQQKAAQWLEGLCRLLNSAIVCSGELLKIIPYGDLALSNNGATWTPNLVPVYSLTDKDFLPWHPHQDGAEPEVGQDDPIIVTRTNPADAFNWYSMEYLDRANFYNSTILAVYDQGAIDQYGLRIGDSLPGKCFASATSAQVSAQLILQRAQFIRNTPYKFQIGWDKALLEPMDLVLLTGSAGDSYLVNEAVRVLSIEENDNGDLTVEAEKVQTGTAAPPQGGPGAVNFSALTFLQTTGFAAGGLTGISNSPTGTFSVGLNPGAFADMPVLSPQCVIRSTNIGGLPDTTANPAFAIVISTSGMPISTPGPLYGFGGTGSLTLFWRGTGLYTDQHLEIVTLPNVVVPDGNWHNLFVAWDMSGLTANVYWNGVLQETAVYSVASSGFDVGYLTQTGWFVSGGGNTFGIEETFYGCMQDLWFDPGVNLGGPAKFITGGRAANLGATGSVPTGSPPILFLHYQHVKTNAVPPADPYNPNQPGVNYFGNNYGTGGDMLISGDSLAICGSNPY